MKTPLSKLPFSDSPYYGYLKKKAREVGGHWVVFGVNEGVCCAHIMAGNPKIDLVGVDVVSNALAHRLSREYGFRYLIQSSLDFEPETEIDAVFFDSLHTAEHVSQEYRRVRPHLKNGAHLFFDDIEMGGIEDFLRAVPGRFEALPHLHTNGFGVIRWHHE